ncbi:branched-chain amino acid ABC transporter permease [Aminobacter sp. LjRoot7]|uniref:branched-chain amino acid ABC transporter permease n=1 Tax=Aminobacter sp. LjRoot7 TaxID=3342335 RepID=UPI003F4F7C3B
MAGLIALVALALLPLFVNDGVTFIIGLAIIEAVFALSWNLLFNYAGIASFGHAAFFALGAYFVGCAQRYGWPLDFFGQLAVAFLLGGATAFVIGAVALKRASGIHFAILTLAIAELVRMVIGYVDYFGRDEGLGGIPRPVVNLGVASLDLRSSTAYYWCILAVCLVVALALWWLVRSRYGRALRSIAQDPERATFIGINVYRFKVISFAVSGAVAAICGGLSAPWVQIVTPDLSHWLHSAQPMLNSLLGGSSLFWGPAVGAFAYALINYATRTLDGASEIVIGGVLIGIILIAPTGISGAAVALKRWLSGARAGNKPAQAQQIERTAP